MTPVLSDCIEDKNLQTGQGLWVSLCAWSARVKRHNPSLLDPLAALEDFFPSVQLHALLWLDNCPEDSSRQHSN